MLTVLIRLLVITGFLTLSMTAAQADTHEEKVGNEQQTQVFRLNVSPNGYPPYLIVHGDNYSGILWEVMTVIATRLNYTVEAVKIPRKRVDRMIISGFMDGTMRARSWTDEPGQFVWSDPIVNAEEVFLHLAEDSFYFEKPDDLRGKSILTHLGYQYPTLDPLFENNKATRFDVSHDENQLRYLLHADRFDATIIDRLVAQWMISQNALFQGKFRATDNSISNVSLRLMVRADMAEFITAFNVELDELKTSGRLDDIVRRYQ